MSAEPDDEDYEVDPDAPCHYCGGEGFGTQGWDGFRFHSLDEGGEGPLMDCPCCGGSGRKADERFW